MARGGADDHPRELGRRRRRARSRRRRARRDRRRLAARGVPRRASASASTPPTPGAPATDLADPAAIDALLDAFDGRIGLDRLRAGPPQRLALGARVADGPARARRRRPDRRAGLAHLLRHPRLGRRRVHPRDARHGRGLRRDQPRPGARARPRRAARAAAARAPSRCAAAARGRRRPDDAGPPERRPPSRRAGDAQPRSTGRRSRRVAPRTARRARSSSACAGDPGRSRRPPPRRSRVPRDVGRRPGPRHARPARSRAATADPAPRPADLDRRLPPRRPLLPLLAPAARHLGRRSGGRDDVDRDRRRRGRRGHRLAGAIDRRAGRRARSPAC